MKCPVCNFICADSRDICSSCGVDLRPHKKALGLPITDPDTPTKELRKALNKKKSAPTKKEKPKKKQKLAGKKVTKKQAKEKAEDTNLGIMEFGDLDDNSLEQALDAMIGDMDIDVEAVHEDKPEVEKEVSFAIEELAGGDSSDSLSNNLERTKHNMLAFIGDEDEIDLEALLAEESEELVVTSSKSESPQNSGSPIESEIQELKGQLEIVMQQLVEVTTSSIESASTNEELSEDFESIIEAQAKVIKDLSNLLEEAHGLEPGSIADISKNAAEDSTALISIKNLILDAELEKEAPTPLEEELPAEKKSL